MRAQSIDRHFEDFTWFMVGPRILKTNNMVESYFGTTAPNRIKHRYKTKGVLNAELAGLAMHKSFGKSRMGSVGLVVSMLEIMGKLASIGYYPNTNIGRHPLISSSESSF